jgi:hypothetical protein
MGLFGRRRGGDDFEHKSALSQISVGDVHSFWRWWGTEGATECARAIASRNGADQLAALNPAIDRLDPRLCWEFGPGTRSQHRLVVTAEGDVSVRALARRWTLAAPDADDTWEYFDTRPADPDYAHMVVGIGGVDLTIEDTRVSFGEPGESLGVRMFHPQYGKLPDRGEVMAFLTLAAVLGELDAALWIGEVDVVTQPLEQPRTLGELKGAVENLRRVKLGPDGEPTWTILSSTADGPARMAVVQTPLRSMFAPQLDTHVNVEVPYVNCADNGLPETASLESLRLFQGELEQRIKGAGRVVAHETCNGVRILHVYVDSTASVVTELGAATAGWGEGLATLHSTYDPEWSAVSHLRG